MMKEIRTSLGPHGRTKAVMGGSAMIITKDAQQLLQIPATHALDKTLCSLCTMVSERCGDGSLRTFLLLQDMLQRLHDMEERVHWLHALEIIARCIQSQKLSITKYMLARGTWWTTTPTTMKHDPLSMWSTMLLPGSNSAMTSNLLQLLQRWLLPVDITSNILLIHCRIVLDQWDRHVITNVSGLPLSESYVVPPDEIVLEARCRDFSMLRQVHLSPTKMIQWRFLPVKWVSTPSTSLSNSAIETVTLQLDRLSDLVSNNHGNTLPRLYQQLIDRLQEHHVSVLLCCENVQEEWIHYAASRSVTLVDCVPVFYLERLATITETPLYDTAQEYLASLFLTTTVKDSSMNPYPTITGLHRVTFGARSDSYFRLTGLRGKFVDKQPRSVNVSVDTPHESMRVSLQPIAPQLVLHSSSIIAAGMHTRMLKRCLRSTIASNDITTSGSFTSATVSVDEKKTAVATESVVWVPGAGAVEMGWAVLWTAIATRLHNGITTSTTTITTSSSFVSTLANDFATNIMESIHRMYSIPLHIVSAVVRCERLCEMLAAAYTRIPLLLLQNASYTPHCDHHDQHDPTIFTMSRKVESVWRLWNDAFVQPYSTGRLGLLTQVDMLMDGVGTTTETMGIGSSMWCIDTPLCSLADVLTNHHSNSLSVMESASTQWEIIAAVLGGCQLYLRIGGKNGVIRVHKLQGTSSSLRGCFVIRKRHDEDNNTSDDDDDDDDDSNSVDESCVSDEDER